MKSDAFCSYIVIFVNKKMNRKLIKMMMSL